MNSKRFLAAIRTGLIGNISGNFSTMAAVLMVPLMAASALAVDYSRIERLRSDMQAATDSAALAAAVEGIDKKKKAKAEAKKMFSVAMADYDNVKLKVKDVNIEGDSVQVIGWANLDLVFGAFIGRPTMEIMVDSIVELGSDEQYEIVLVLDNTYSMKGQKVKDLVKAADIFMDLLAAKPNADIKVGLVPFSRYVNVGLKNRSAVWLDVPPDSSKTRYVCSNKRDVISKTNCRWEWRTRFRDGIEERYQKKVCDKVYGEPYEVCRNRTNRTTWHGCVGSREHPLDTQAAYDSKPIPGLMDIRCGLEIKPLSTDLKLAKRKLKKMLVNDETYLPAGFLWGWRLLTNQHPFSEAAPKGPTVRKVMVMMTDGETTASPSYPKHTGSDTQQSDAIMRQICETAKMQDDIRIITIKVDKKKNAKKKGALADSFLSCASSPNDAFLVQDSDKLTAVFEDIADRIVPIRLAQ